MFSQPEIKVHLEIASIFAVFFLVFSSFLKPVFKCPFVHPMIFLSYLVKNSMDRVSVICKLATYEMVSNAHVRQLTAPPYDKFSV